MIKQKGKVQPQQQKKSLKNVFAVGGGAQAGGMTQAPCSQKGPLSAEDQAEDLSRLPGAQVGGGNVGPFPSYTPNP